MRDPSYGIALPDYLDFGRTPVHFSDHILADTTDRLFPVSKHRSARIHKKLVKRFGGEFRQEPTIYMIDGQVFAHTSFQAEFHRRFSRQASPTGRLQSKDRTLRYTDTPVKPITVVNHVALLDDIDVVEHMQTKKSAYELLDADEPKAPLWSELEFRAMGQLIAEQVRQQEDRSFFQSLYTNTPSLGERITNEKLSADVQKPLTAAEMCKRIQEQMNALDIRPFRRTSIFRDAYGY